jgi:CHAT domain-containing protein
VTGQPGGAKLRERGERAVALATDRPGRARIMAERLRATARSAGDAEAESLAEQALGRAAAELQENDTALAHLHRAVALADGAGLAVRAARARLSLAVALAYAGACDEALAALALAEPELAGIDRARLDMQRAGILVRLGRLTEAMPLMSQALAAFAEEGDERWLARAFNNRGLMHGMRGDHARAARDLEQSLALWRRVGDRLAVAQTEYNLAEVAAHRGEVPEALRRYEASAAAMEACGLSSAHYRLGRAATFLSVRLCEDAEREAVTAAAAFDRTNMALDAAEARLLAARATLLRGDAVQAAELARRVARVFARQHRPGHEALARHVLVQAGATTAPSKGGARLVDQAEELAGRLSDLGWPVLALDALLVAGRLALERGDRERGLGLLKRATEAREVGPVDMRARAWHAEALAALARDDEPAAEEALRRGLEVVDLTQAALGSTDLRTHAAGHATELAALGLRMAVASGDPGRMLTWAESHRAVSLRWRPARPGRHGRVSQCLAELRALTAEQEETALAGEDVGPALARQAAVEEELRRMAHQARSRASTSRPADAEAQAFHVPRNHTLVELLDVGGQLHAVVAGRRGPVTMPLGPAEPVRQSLSALRFALSRLAMEQHSEVRTPARLAAVSAAVATLDTALVAPYRSLLGEGRLVLSPPAALHAVPWPALPSLTGRHLAVTPSAATWSRARRRRGGDGRAVVIAGPNLVAASREVEMVAAHHRGATVLQGSCATVTAALAALPGASVAHLCCHGTFRADNPYFSELRLADGPLTLFDMEQLRRPPRIVVLSACDAGLSDARPGEELMGLVTTLLGMGTAAVVAPAVPVPDEATVAVMDQLHRLLGAGEEVAAALAAVQADPGLGPAARAAATSFVCFGWGGARVAPAR